MGKGWPLPPLPSYPLELAHPPPCCCHHIPPPCARSGTRVKQGQGNNMKVEFHRCISVQET